MTGRLILNYNLGTQGAPWPAWRHPDSRAEQVTSLDFFVEQARIAEQGCFDAVFVVDSLAQFPDPDAALFWVHDPIVVLAAIAARTTHIGLIATISTSFTQPYPTARALAALDHLSNGRAGWNVVTSDSELAARNHGQPATADSASRYQRAHDHLDAALQLWHAWDPDAVPADKATCRLVDPDKIHAINFHGDEIAVRGPLSTPRSPQVVPVICQAGPSPSGRDLAARYADLVYARFDDLEPSRRYRTDLRARARAAGRPADSIKLVPALTPFVKSTDAEARHFHRELTELYTPAQRLTEMTDTLGVDLTARELRTTVPPEHRAAARHHWPWIATTETIDWTGPSITWSELLHAIDSRHQHHVLVGTPEHVADHLIRGYEHGAFDGVTIAAPLVPGSLRDFVDLVVPILQRRGVHQHTYPAGTLRQRLGLPVTQPHDNSRWTSHYAVGLPRSGGHGVVTDQAARAVA